MPFARSSDDSEDVRRQGNMETIQRKGAFQRKKRHIRTQEDVTARLSLTSKSRREKEDREKDFRHNHEQTRQPKYDYSYGNYEVDDDTSHRNKKNKSIDELEESKKNERHVHKNKEHSDKREIRKHKKTRDHKDKSKRDSHHSRPKKIIKRRKSIDDEERERECSNEHYEYANDILNNDSDTNEDVLRKRLLKQSTLEHDTDENQINSISSIIEKNLDIILEKAKEDCENYSSLNQDDDADDEDGGDSPNKYSFDNEEMDDPANQSYNTFHNVRSKFESGSIEMSDAEIDYNNIHHNNSMSDSSSSSTSSYGSSISSSRNPKKKKQRKTNSNDVNIEEKLVFSPVEYDDYSAIEVDNRPFYYPAVQGCRLVEEFECLNKIEEGTYGVVFRARDRKTNEIVALKRLKMEKERDGFPITSLREINTLMKARHINIVTVREIVVGSNMDKIYLVMDFIEHDLKSLMLSMVKPFEICEVKCLMLQLLHAVAHLHDNWILHRDLKTSNLLLSHRGVLKVADFGLAREYGSPLKNYTRVVVTLWYRAPELLLGTKVYSTQIDLWSVGCIFGELLLMAALFPGKSEMDQINILFRELGTPNEKIWPGFSQLPNVKRFEFGKYEYNRLTRRFGPQLSESGLQLINRFLAYCPERRITADEAIRHHYFNETPLAISPEMFPTRPAKSEGAIPSRARITASPKPPSGGGQGGKCLNDDDRIIGIEHMYLRRA